MKQENRQKVTELNQKVEVSRATNKKKEEQELKEIMKVIDMNRGK